MIQEKGTCPGCGSKATRYLPSQSNSNANVYRCLSCHKQFHELTTLGRHPWALQLGGILLSTLLLGGVMPWLRDGLHDFTQDF